MQLEQILDKSLYGVGAAKSWDALMSEIESGESQIVWEDNKPVRQIELMFVQVQGNRESGFSEMKLIEAYQQFVDGRKRERGLQGVSEKMKPGEDRLQAAKRALAEELGFSGEDVEAVEIILEPQVKREEKESPSYPGLLTRYVQHTAIAYLPQHLYREQYVEVQADKQTVFIWSRA